jgi:hypothetical protein
MSVYINNSEPKETIRNDSRYNKKNYSYYFISKNLSIFYPYSKLFLAEENGKFKKIVPSLGDLDELLSPAAFFWIMDDGQYVKRGGLTLCTDSYSYDEVLLLKSILENKYDLSCTIHNKNNLYFRIYISGRSLPLITKLVSEYMHPSMLYKLDK